MRDIRIQKLASVLVNYSTSVKKGDLVHLMGFMLAEPLILELYRETLKAGGHPIVYMVPQECMEIRLRHASEEQLQFFNPIELYATEEADVVISILVKNNTKDLSGIDPKKQAISHQARKQIMQTFMDRIGTKDMRWVGTQLPCHAAAQEAEMSIWDFEDFVFQAGLLHKENPAGEWKTVSEHQQNLTDYLNTTHELHFKVPNGTDLKVAIENRGWVNFDGHQNFPDGEVCTAPIEDATEGVVFFSYPAVYHGREVDNVRLEFKAGRVVEASASKGEDFLIAMLDQDDGARFLGEIAFGTNYSITRFSKNILFDEKMGGTFHAALGAALFGGGGKNKSAMHWDMVCELKQGGQVFADGKLISDNGRFTKPEWPSP